MRKESEGDLGESRLEKMNVKNGKYQLDELISHRIYNMDENNSNMIVDVRRELSDRVNKASSSLLPPTESNETNQPTQLPILSTSSVLASSYVELTLQKLVLLLQVGFGSAGSEIIASNVIGDYLDPMIPGTKQFAVFGFCDIRNFNALNELLQERIMLFVNQIASILHGATHQFGGTVNKNIGSAFLLIWKFEQQDMKSLKYATKQYNQKWKQLQKSKSVSFHSNNAAADTPQSVEHTPKPSLSQMKKEKEKEKEVAKAKDQQKEKQNVSISSSSTSLSMDVAAPAAPALHSSSPSGSPNTASMPASADRANPLRRISNTNAESSKASSASATPVLIGEGFADFSFPSQPSSQSSSASQTPISRHSTSSTCTTDTESLSSNPVSSTNSPFVTPTRASSHSLSITLPDASVVPQPSILPTRASDVLSRLFQFEQNAMKLTPSPGDSGTTRTPLYPSAHPENNEEFNKMKQRRLRFDSLPITPSMEPVADQPADQTAADDSSSTPVKTPEEKSLPSLPAVASETKPLRVDSTKPSRAHASSISVKPQANKTVQGEPKKATTPSSKNSQQHQTPLTLVRTAVHRIAQQALTAFMSSIIQISTANSMLQWRNDPLLIREAAEHGNGMIPSIGTGLHVGWAIEGAIGSCYKIDASYLSPNVNLAARLCSATKQYGVSLLFSGPFYRLLDPAIQVRCRRLDQVQLKGSAFPMDIYTFDICPGWLHLNNDNNNQTQTAETTPPPAAAAQNNETQPSAEWSVRRDKWLQHVGSVDVKQFSNHDGTPASKRPSISLTNVTELSASSSSSSNGTTPAASGTASPNAKHAPHSQSTLIASLNTLLSQLQSSLPPNYVENFNRAVRYYVQGDWSKAGSLLVQFQAAHRQYINGLNLSEAERARYVVDGPCRFLLRYMGQAAFQAPKDWKGVRMLHKK